ncbi:hypothetical protein TSAR_016140 [Trichomalopsis sarcophagae]|uniref:Uncharacterized protein n=1 Tax=Trichomalopsis sarcophagae TaxID=543379 RepID=A0A232FHB9_9HYME|nr:hypothetical protein TSAR_016140 [Trichomalopsis sarcophagae]
MSKADHLALRELQAPQSRHPTF